MDKTPQRKKNSPKIDEQKFVFGKLILFEKANQ